MLPPDRDRPPIALRLRYRQLGGHMHCRVFSARATDHTFGTAGDLVFAVEEWPAVRAVLERVIEILPIEES
ncbi:MAG TPA: hypothetical protein VKR23_16110 [Gaiellaceae bacterium]|nr:hypothetical protein [Gaiellaceae bacterium]